MTQQIFFKGLSVGLGSFQQEEIGVSERGDEVQTHGVQLGNMGNVLFSVI
jgi:hypothetical protein